MALYRSLRLDQPNYIALTRSVFECQKRRPGMSTSEKQGLLKRSTLTEVEIAEITQLVEQANRHDNLRMRIPLEALAQRSGTEINDFLYYEQGVLVGYLY